MQGICKLTGMFIRHASKVVVVGTPRQKGLESLARVEKYQMELDRKVKNKKIKILKNEGVTEKRKLK